MNEEQDNLGFEQKNETDLEISPPVVVREELELLSLKLIKKLSC